MSAYYHEIESQVSEIKSLGFYARRLFPLDNMMSMDDRDEDEIIAFLDALGHRLPEIAENLNRFVEKVSDYGPPTPKTNEEYEEEERRFEQDVIDAFVEKLGERLPAIKDQLQVLVKGAQAAKTDHGAEPPTSEQSGPGEPENDGE